MSGTFPNTSGFETMDFQSNVNTRVTTTVSNKTQRIKTGGQYFSFKLKSPPMNRTSFMSDYSFLISQDGQFDTFTLVPPVVSSTTGTMTGTLTVSSVESVSPSLNLSAGSTQLAVQDDSTAGTLKKGDLIKFSNHDKVYMLTQDLNLNGDSSIGVLAFYPALTTDVTGGTTTIQYTDVPFKVFLDADQVKYTINQSGLYQYEFSVIEEI